jgi:hypothetical protein|nr:hypothetical protein [Kofleriaceae bacterium]
MPVPDPDKLAAVLQLLASVRQTHARVLQLVSELTDATLPSAACRLAREGDYWSVAHAGTVTRLRDSKGLQYLAVLVARPHVEIAATELVGAPTDRDAPLLDQQARRAYARRLAELGDDGDEATALTRELARGVGLGGRLRRAGVVERARINATRTIKDAITRLARGDRDLGRHLAASVRTGTYCCYDPHVARSWLVT